MMKCKDTSPPVSLKVLLLLRRLIITEPFNQGIDHRVLDRVTTKMLYSIINVTGGLQIRPTPEKYAIPVTQKNAPSPWHTLEMVFCFLFF